MNQHEQFQSECRANAKAMSSDPAFREQSDAWRSASFAHRYTYNFTWLGRPIIQSPVDILAVQEILHATRPEIVIETGIAHGGSLILSASILELNAIAGGPSDAMVVGIDIDIRPHNRDAILSHPLSRRIRMIQGSSVSKETIDQVHAIAEGKKVAVFLDSNHTHRHVADELAAYAPLVAPGSYCVVFDTQVEFLPPSCSEGRPWSPGNSPMTAVREFLADNPDFENDQDLENKLMTSSSPGGFLRRAIR